MGRFEVEPVITLETSAIVMRRLPSRYVTTLRRAANGNVRRGDDFEYHSSRSIYGKTRECSEEVYRLEKLGFLFLSKDGKVEITTLGYGYLHNMHTENGNSNNDEDND